MDFELCENTGGTCGRCMPVLCLYKIKKHDPGAIRVCIYKWGRANGGNGSHA